jgi:hypothetical protein
MLTSLTISGFRTFRKLHVDQLARVNLFVGTNNAGKTSILEATELVALGTSSALFRSPLRRGERIVESLENAPASREIDLSHLFYGHSLRPGSSFSIQSTGPGSGSVFCQILAAEPTQDSEEALFKNELPLDFTETGLLSLHFKGQNEATLYLSPDGGVTERSRRLLIHPNFETAPTVNFLGTENPDNSRLGRLWDAVVLTPEEKGVAEALRIIEPQIERIAFLSETRQSSNIFLKFTSSDQRLPLGSLGDGLKHLLALTLHLSAARDGFLLVDEIDTGLHYTVMEDMWRLVIETATRLNVQVFSTTHSLDCVRALARIRAAHPEIASEVMLHRIEKNSSTTVSYNTDELLIAAKSQLEVR